MGIDLHMQKGELSAQLFILYIAGPSLCLPPEFSEFDTDPCEKHNKKPHCRADHIPYLYRALKEGKCAKELIADEVGYTEDDTERKKYNKGIYDVACGAALEYKTVKEVLIVYVKKNHQAYIQRE